MMTKRALSALLLLIPLASSETVKSEWNLWKRGLRAGAPHTTKVFQDGEEETPVEDLGRAKNKDPVVFYGRVWYDDNANSKIDNGEKSVEGVSVELRSYRKTRGGRNRYAKLKSITVKSDGLFEIPLNSIAKGSQYYLKFVNKEEDYEFAPFIAGGDNGVVNEKGNSERLTVQYGQRYQVNAGLVASNSNAAPPPRKPTVVGGELTEIGEFPFFVDWGGCGGSLIHEDIVLSARHCPNAPFLYVGAWREDSEEGISQKREIEQRVPHPDHDVVVLKLKKRSTLDTIPLNGLSDQPIDDEMLLAMGHGHTEYGGSSSEFLLKVDLPAMSNDDCTASYPYSFAPDSEICAGYPEGGKDTCQGDSGGPLLEMRDGAYVQVGITTWGDGCASPGKPGVYARVSAVKDWIDDQVCKLASNPPSRCFLSMSDEELFQYAVDAAEGKVPTIGKYCWITDRTGKGGACNFYAKARPDAIDVGMDGTPEGTGCIPGPGSWWGDCWFADSVHLNAEERESMCTDDYVANGADQIRWAIRNGLCDEGPDFMSMPDKELFQYAVDAGKGKKPRIYAYCYIQDATAIPGAACDYYAKGEPDGIEVGVDGVPAGTGCISGSSFCWYANLASLTAEERKSMCTDDYISNGAAQIRWAIQNGFCHREGIPPAVRE